MTIWALTKKFPTETMNWIPGWHNIEEPSMQGDISELLEEAKQLIKSADTKQKVLDLIRIYKWALKIEPGNREALRGASWYSFLIALGYSNEKEGKCKYFKQSIGYCEQLMYLNQNFKKLVDGGDRTWEACRALSKNDIDALFLFWVASSCLWADCQNGFEKMIQLKWTARGKKELRTLMEIDPTWGGGTPYYAWAVYFTGAPRIAGGDMKKAEVFYEKAIQLGPDMLNYRRTRAMLFHTKRKDKEAFKKDLNWVISQDPTKDRHYFTYPFSVFLQREAREALDNMGSYF